MRETGSGSGRVAPGRDHVVRPVAARAGVARADIVLGLAGLALVAAAGYPRVERAGMERRSVAAGDAVEAVREAALSARGEDGAWPEGAPPGVVPGPLQHRLPPGFSFRVGPCTLQWARWEAPDADALAPTQDPPADEAIPPGLSRRLLAAGGAGFPSDSALAGISGELAASLAPADSLAGTPPPIATLGTITVTSADARVLAALLDRFGTARSFVRDSTWTLVLSGPGPS